MESQNLENVCWELLKSSQYPGPGFMLCDGIDVSIVPQISGDVFRQRSLQTLSERYCKEVLLILFSCYETMNRYDVCISFMSKVRER